MSLYDRKINSVVDSRAGDHFGDRATEQEFAGSRIAFIKQTYQLLTASLIAATGGAFLGITYIKEASWTLLILEFAMLFGLFFAKNKPNLALILLFGFTFVSGLTLGPVLNMYIGAGMGNVITQAFLMTSVAFAGLTLFAFNTKRDFSAMGKMLFITLIVVVVASLANLFFHSPILQLAIAGVGAILFSAFILYDTQNIIRGAYDSPVLAAVALYLDILNLFISLLQILGVFNSRD
nr:Bax inhibitor-1/YccA family protein [Campylobacter sp.]